MSALVVVLSEIHCTMNVLTLSASICVQIYIYVLVNGKQLFMFYPVYISIARQVLAPFYVLYNIHVHVCVYRTTLDFLISCVAVSTSVVNVTANKQVYVLTYQSV